VRALGSYERFVWVQVRGVILIPPAARSTGPWLDATRTTSLQRIANRPIVSHVLDALGSAGVEEIAVLAPAELIEEIATCIESDSRPRPPVRYLAHHAQTQAAESLRSIARFADGAATIVHRSDGLLGQPLAPFLEVLSQESPDVVLLVAQGARNSEPLGPATQQVMRVADLDPNNSALGMAGVCVLGAGALDGLRYPAASPGIELRTLAECLIARENAHMQVRVVREWRAFLGDPIDLLDMNRAVLDELDPELSPPQRDGNRFEGRVIIDPTASVTSSMLCGPVIVGAGAHVADSYIGPHTSIGERVHVEGAEIERSILFAGASVIHVGGRLVGSIVGRDARVFRDFSVPRAMRLQVGDGDKVALC
jgi:glucose-1-phosphate thymidylyltransferase